MSEVYLMHLYAPVCAHRPARHYLGFSSNTVKREQDYRRGLVGYHGRLMLAAHERRIDFTVARVWKNCTKRDEKLLRDLHNNPKLCPVCNPSLNLQTRLNAAGRYQTYATRDPRRARYGDLRVLRHRKLRPARQRQRRDGSLNYVPHITAPDVPTYADEPLTYEQALEQAIVSGQFADPSMHLEHIARTYEARGFIVVRGYDHDILTSVKVDFPQ